MTAAMVDGTFFHGILLMRWLIFAESARGDLDKIGIDVMYRIWETSRKVKVKVKSVRRAVRKEGSNFHVQEEYDNEGIRTQSVPCIRTVGIKPVRGRTVLCNCQLPPVALAISARRATWTRLESGKRQNNQP